MGLIKAAVGAIGSTLHDTWLDAIKCDNLDNSTLMIKKTTPNGIISKGSRIIVNPGQAAIIVDNGNVLDAAAQPGQYTFDESTSPSFFSGDFGGVFMEMAERFTYGGSPAREQAVYFVNTKEIIDNKFGTPAPVPYKDWGHPNFNPRNNTMYPMAVNIKAFGTFTFKVSDPFKFIGQIGGTAQRYTKDMLEDQIKSEFIAVFKNTLAELGSDKYKIEAMDLPHKDDEIVSAMNGKKYDANILARGISIISVAVESIKFDEESDKKIRDYELSDAYTQSGYMAGATGRAMEAAANNKSGAMTGFMGVGMAQNVGGANNVLGNMMSAQQAAQAAQQAAGDIWACVCGCKTNKGKFCSECGKGRPAGSGWKCDKCGWKPEDKANPPKFCPECGDPFNSDDDVK